MKNKVQTFLLAFCSFMAIGFDVYAFYQKQYSSLLKLGFLGSALLFLGFLFLYSKKRHRKSVVISVLSSIFTFFMIFGNSYMHLGNALLVFKNILFFFLSVMMALGYFFIFRVILSFVFDFLDKKSFTKGKKNKVFQTFDKHPFIFSLLFILDLLIILLLFLWLPYTFHLP